MGEQVTEEVPDVVVFFDANMPDMAKCNGSECKEKFCIHKFNFRVKEIHCRKAIAGLDDFQVIQHFFKIARNYEFQHNQIRKPLFVFVSKDTNFLEKDVPRAYAKALKAKRNEIKITLGKDYFFDGENIIFFREIASAPCGLDKQDNQRCVIEELNELWNRKKLLE